MGTRKDDSQRAHNLIHEASRGDGDFAIAVFTADCMAVGGFYWFQDWKHLAHWMRDLAVAVQEDTAHELDQDCIQRVEHAAMEGDARSNPSLEDDLEAVLGFENLADNGVRIDIVDDVLNKRGDEYADVRELFYSDLPELDEDAVRLVRGLKYVEDEGEVDTSRVSLASPVPAKLHDLYKQWVRSYTDLHS